MRILKNGETAVLLMLTLGLAPVLCRRSEDPEPLSKVSSGYNPRGQVALNDQAEVAEPTNEIGKVDEQKPFAPERFSEATTYLDRFHEAETRDASMGVVLDAVVKLKSTKEGVDF